LRGSFSRRLQRQVIDNEKVNQWAEKVVLVFLVIVFSLLIAWLARYVVGGGE
jgi:hypothetical protein